MSGEALTGAAPVECCFRCGICWVVCPSGAVLDDAAGIRIDISVCSRCQVCVKVCPAALIGESHVG